MQLQTFKHTSYLVLYVQSGLCVAVQYSCTLCNFSLLIKGVILGVKIELNIK